MARSMVSLVMFSARAAMIAARSRGFMAGSGVPSLAATVTSRASLPNNFDFAASCRPLRCMMFLNCEWPAIVHSLRLSRHLIFPPLTERNTIRRARGGIGGADRSYAVGVIKVGRVELIIDRGFTGAAAAKMLVEKAKNLPVGGAVGGIGRQRPGPPRYSLMAFELIEHQAVRIDPAAELLRDNAAPGTDRFPLIDADGAPRIRMHEPAQRKSPVMIFDRGEHRAQMIVGPPIVVVEIGDIAAVGQIGQNATQHAAVIGWMQ